MLNGRDEATYLENIDEFCVCDVAILVLVEVIEDDTELLSGEENAKLRHEFLELELLQNTVLVAIEALSKWKSNRLALETNLNSLIAIFSSENAISSLSEAFFESQTDSQRHSLGSF